MWLVLIAIASPKVLFLNLPPSLCVEVTRKRVYLAFGADWNNKSFNSYIGLEMRLL